MPRRVLDEPRFRNEQAAYAYVEALVWPDGRVCPHSRVIGNSGLLKGKSTRIGVYKCYAFRKPFTVKVGTIFEKSHIPMHTWLQAMHLLCSSREAMSNDGSSGPLGGESVFVEADETFIGGRARNRAYKSPAPKKAVVALVERKGRVRLSATSRK
jgi:transposase-like protein